MSAQDDRKVTFVPLGCRLAASCVTRRAQFRLFHCFLCLDVPCHELKLHAELVLPVQASPPLPLTVHISSS